MSKSWFTVLPNVYELLLDNPEAIVDDTSMEKVLLWLQEIFHNKEELDKLLNANTGTFEFLHNERVFSNSMSLAFALRLLGILCANQDIYLVLDSSKAGGFVRRFLQKTISKDSAAWHEAAVRNAWIKCWSSVLDNDNGLELMKTLGHINKVLEALHDQSIFVSSSAEKCFAKYVVKANKQSSFGDAGTSFDHLRSLVTSSNPVVVLNVIHNIMTLDHVRGQETLTQRPFLYNIMQLLKTSDLSVCWKIVELVTELSINTRKWNLDWTALLARGDNIDSHLVSSLTAGEMLLELPIILFKRGFLPCALRLMPGLISAATSNQHTSSFPDSWLDILYKLTDLPLKILYDKLQDGGSNLEQEEGLLIKNEENALDIASLARELSHNCEAALPKVGDLIREKTEQKNFSVDTTLHTLAVMQDLVKQHFETDKSGSFQHYVILTADVLESCLSMQDIGQTPYPSSWHGNKKVLRVCLDTFARFAEYQLFNGPRENSLSVKEHFLFLRVFKLILQVIESSKTDGIVIICAFKTLATLAKYSNKSWVENLLNDTSFDEPERKRRYKSNSGTLFSEEQGILNETKLIEKLAFLIHRHLRDHRWEIRDSVLEFISSGVLQGYMQHLLVKHSIHLLVWKAITDSESFVRASALHLLSHCVCDCHVWSALQQTRSPEDVLTAICEVLRDDPDAFPRRRAMECLVLWIRKKHPITDRLMCCINIRNLERETKEKQLLLENQKYSDAIKAIYKASQDFDWEVKLLALDFWEALIGYSILRPHVLSNSSESSEVTYGIALGTRKTFTASEDPSVLTVLKSPEDLEDKTGVLDCNSQSQLTKSLDFLNAVGAVRVIVDALGDCDLMVRERVVALLISFKGQCTLTSKFTFSNIDELKAEIDGKGDELTVTELGKIIEATDFEGVLKSLCPLDGNIRSDPVSFLEDILAAAANRKENLLDCY